MLTWQKLTDNIRCINIGKEQPEGCSFVYQQFLPTFGDINLMLPLMKRSCLFYLFILLVTSMFAQKQDSVYVTVEQMPSFPGGEEAMHRFLIENLKYPDIPGEKWVENLRTTLRFTITKTGEIKDIVPVRPQYAGTILTDSLTAVIRKMPKWIPGKHKGKNVDVYFTMPLHISPPHR